MGRSSLLPQGVRLSRASRTKVRALNLNDANNFWDTFWSTSWSAAKLATMLSATKAAGYNTVKIYCDGLPSVGAGGNVANAGVGYPPDAVLLPRLQGFFALCRANGLRIYLAMNQGIEFQASTAAQTNANLATEAKVLGWFRDYAADLVVAVDLCNEANGSTGGGKVWGTSPTYGTAINAAAKAGLASLVQMGRAACPFPLTFSVFIGSDGAMASNDWFDAQYDLGCDFHDYHPYKDFSSNNYPKLSDVASLKGRTKYLGRHMIGECGTGHAGGTDGVTRPAGWQTFWAGQMSACAADKDSFGAVWFMAVPYDNGGSAGLTPSDYNAFDAAYASPVPDVIAGTRLWPQL